MNEKTVEKDYYNKYTKVFSEDFLKIIDKLILEEEKNLKGELLANKFLFFFKIGKAEFSKKSTMRPLK